LNGFGTLCVPTWSHWQAKRRYCIPLGCSYDNWRLTSSLTFAYSWEEPSCIGDYRKTIRVTTLSPLRASIKWADIAERCRILLVHMVRELKS